jgi:hypothetical protein
VQINLYRRGELWDDIFNSFAEERVGNKREPLRHSKETPPSCRESALLITN